MIFDGTGSTCLVYNHEDVHKLPICTFLFALHICIPTSKDSSAHGLRVVKHRARCLHRECDKLRTGERRHQWLGVAWYIIDLGNQPKPIQLSLRGICLTNLDKDWGICEQRLGLKYGWMFVTLLDLCLSSFRRQIFSVSFQLVFSPDSKDRSLEKPTGGLKWAWVWKNPTFS